MEIPGTRAELEQRIRILLPEQYQGRYQDVQPISMGSAGLKYGRDGKVAWGEIWGSFCDLAMAGGPPHKGTLLAPGSSETVAANPEDYAGVCSELIRGIDLVAYVPARMAPQAGWIAVDCNDATTAGWLARAICMENVSSLCEGSTLFLPAGPEYRVEKEIKNVITSVAKTCHYWFDHTRPAQRAQIGELFAAMSAVAPLVQPGWSGVRSDWKSVPCADAAKAIWLMRALVASNIMARREDTTLFAARNPELYPGDEHLKTVLEQISAYAPQADSLRP